MKILQYIFGSPIRKLCNSSTIGFSHLYYTVQSNPEQKKRLLTHLVAFLCRPSSLDAIFLGQALIVLQALPVSNN